MWFERDSPLCFPPPVDVATRPISGAGGLGSSGRSCMAMLADVSEGSKPSERPFAAYRAVQVRGLSTPATVIARTNTAAAATMGEIRRDSVVKMDLTPVGRATAAFLRSGTFRSRAVSNTRSSSARRSALSAGSSPDSNASLRIFPAERMSPRSPEQAWHSSTCSASLAFCSPSSSLKAICASSISACSQCIYQSPPYRVVKRIRVHIRSALLSLRASSRRPPLMR